MVLLYGWGNEFWVELVKTRLWSRRWWVWMEWRWVWLEWRR